MKKPVVYLAAPLCAMALAIAGCGGGGGYSGGKLIGLGGSGGSTGGAYPGAGGSAGGGGSTGGGGTVANTYTISVSVSGLDASGLVLQDNGGDALSVAADGVSTFATPLASGAAYSVSVATQPGAPSQFCSVTNGSGTVGTSSVANIAVTCKDVAHFAYVSNGDNTVSEYSIDAATGALTSIGSPGKLGGTGGIISAIVADSAGKHVFLLDPVNKELRSATIDRPSGTLLLRDVVPIAGTPLGLAVSPNGNFVYTADSTTGSLLTFAVDSLGGLASVPSTASIAPGGGSLTIDAGGTHLYVNVASDTILFDLDPVTGSITPTTSKSTNSSGSGSIALSPGGFAYVLATTAQTVDVYSINPSTGAFTAAIGHATTGLVPSNVAMDGNSRFVYVADSTENRISVFKADTTGALSTGTDFITATAPYGIAADPTGRFIYTSNPSNATVSAFKIDATTGTLAPVGADVAATGGPRAIAVTK
jgi:6-phosphogluconolactonase (cycloisomerase 2 family)